MRAEAVLYVGDLSRMRSFYEACFAFAPFDSGNGYAGLASPAWLLTLVHTSEAQPGSEPATRRSRTPIKLTFDVDSIDAVRPLIRQHGGQVDPAAAQWSFRESVRCDGVDPEGNVFQLVQR